MGFKGGCKKGLDRTQDIIILLFSLDHYEKSKFQ